MPVPSLATASGDRHATQQVEPTLERMVAAAVIAAISEEAGRVVTPDEVLAVVRALAAER